MFTKKSIARLLAIMMAMAPFFYSCESDKNEFDQEIETTLNTQTDLSQRAKFAKALSLAIQDADFSKLVIEKTRARENGDRVFLYALTKDKEVNGTGLSFQQQLKEKAQANAFFRDDAADFDLDAAEADPSLSVYLHVPEGMEENEVDPSRVSRVYLSPEDDDYTIGQMVSFYENGVMGEHEILQEPNVPVFVIKTNERVLAYDPQTGLVLPYNEPLESHLGSNLIPEFLSSESLLGMIDGIEYRIVFRGGDGDPSGPGTGGGDPPTGGGDDPCEEECERDCLNGKDVMTRFKFSNDHEGWLMGGPEVILRVFFADNPTNNENAEFDMIEKRFDIKRKQENKWQVKNAEIVNWDVESYGLAMLYHWVEKDPGSNGETWPIEFSVSFRPSGSSGNGGNNNGGNNNGGNSNLNFRVRTEIPRNKDDFFGESIVQYCDNWNDPDIPSDQQSDWSTYGYHYVAGDMEFAVKERNY